MALSLTTKEAGLCIKSLRAQRGISQDQLAQMLSIPRSAVSLMEGGARELSFIEIQKILTLFELSFEEFLKFLEPPEKQSEKKKANTRIKFDPDKFKQLLLYILQKCGGRPNVGETVLYKLLYFCDFDYFELFEKPLTGMKYKKMRFGPVPDQSLYGPILSAMHQSGSIEKMARPYMNDTIQTRYLNFIEADLSVFGGDVEKMIKVTDSVIERLSGMSARQIEDHSHRDYPWQSHEFNEEIAYESVFFRNGEFANRDYDKMWEASSSHDILQHLGDMSDEEHQYYLNLLK